MKKILAKQGLSFKMSTKALQDTMCVLDGPEVTGVEKSGGIVKAGANWTRGSFKEHDLNEVNIKEALRGTDPGLEAHRVASRAISSQVAMRIFMMLFLAGAEQCKRGVSLLAHKASLQKSSWFDGYWCPCGGNLDDCSGLLQSSPGLCQRKGCGEDYPARPESCLADHDRAGNTMGTCVHVWGNNCLYTSEVMETNGTCGVRNCTCTSVAPGECTSAALPGYTIVQNGASPMTTGGQATLANGSRVELEDQRAWEPVGGAGNHACRGDNSSDNDPKHYEVITYIKSLWGCKNKCERTWDCRGIEYSPGRCELWKRQEGLFAYQVGSWCHFHLVSVAELTIYCRPVSSCHLLKGS